MRMLTLSLTAMMLAFQLLAAGCAPNAVRNIVARGSAEAGPGLGRTVLICQAALPPDAAKRQEKIPRLMALSAQALQSVPAAQAIPAEALLARLPGRDPAGLSDRELAAAAREAGAESVVLVRVLGYGGELAISLVPPYWMLTTDYAYQARVIDARSGALYLDAYRGRKSGRAFNALGPEDLDRAFAADLADLLAGAARPDAGS